MFISPKIGVSPVDAARLKMELRRTEPRFDLRAATGSFAGLLSAGFGFSRDDARWELRWVDDARDDDCDERCVAPFLDTAPRGFSLALSPAIKDEVSPRRITILVIRRKSFQCGSNFDS